MKLGLTLGGLLLGGTAVMLGHSLSQPIATAVPGGGRDDGGTASAGPDVIVGAIPNVTKWGVANGITSFSFGSTSCNIGTVPLAWVASTNKHPVIPQNAYRLKDGRLQQIGMSFVKHGFCALQQTLCGSCIPAGGGCASLLGIGCSDPYESGLNGSHSYLGPRSQVNASTGYFPYPYTNPPSGGTPTVLLRRIQIANEDINPSLNSGALYFAECQYIHPDDANTGNAQNNASYRRFTTSGSGTNFNIALTGPTFQQKPAITAWQADDPQVVLVPVDVAGDGRFWVAYRVFDNGNGTWRYEYAVQNLTSDRSGGSLTIPIPAGVNVTDIGFHSPAYHSGELFSNSPWATSIQDSMLTWSAQKFDDNVNANAIRWSTLYNFWFTADRPPEPTTGSLGLFKPPAGGKGPDGVLFAAVAPTAPEPALCAADIDRSGFVDGADLGLLLAAWGTDSREADLNLDGTVDGADLGLLLAAWGACP